MFGSRRGRCGFGSLTPRLSRSRYRPQPPYIDLDAMCGRFTQERPASELAEIFGAEPLSDDPGGRYNVAPTDEALVVVQRDERRAVTGYRWGLIPHWADQAKVGSRMFNARAETLVTSPAFRDAFIRKRCLVPVDSFYEWKREGAIRQPYRVVRRDGAALVLAGLWSGWRDPATDTVRRTFTIVTRPRTKRLPISTTGCRSCFPTTHGRAGSIRAPGIPPNSWGSWRPTRPSSSMSTP